MTQVDAETALNYVTSREILYLVSVLLLGVFIMYMGAVMTASHLVPIGILGYVGILAGIAVNLGGMLALFYKIVADATA
ncbi:MAG: hypothetical protein SVY41_02380 [Candidatus Nanohaloarchaea archaeon]|nr:hypothetical protein [Candidatus Nanohaloarchaea archaeon]